MIVPRQKGDGESGSTGVGREFLHDCRPRAIVHAGWPLPSASRSYLVLEGRIGVGTIIVFDEYSGCSGWQNGECRAFSEFAGRFGIRFEYLCHALYQAGVRILDPLQ
jgi:hypothetical protein